MPEIPGAEGTDDRDPSIKRDQSIGVSSSQNRRTQGS